MELGTFNVDISLILFIKFSLVLSAGFRVKGFAGVLGFRLRRNSFRVLCGRLSTLTPKLQVPKLLRASSVPPPPSPEADTQPKTLHLKPTSLNPEA